MLTDTKLRSLKPKGDRLPPCRQQWPVYRDASLGLEDLALPLRLQGQHAHRRRVSGGHAGTGAIKQHLRIKAFFGTPENAVKTQIWIAISVYVIVAIVKKRMKIPASLYEILLILSLTVFEIIPLDQLLARSVEDEFADGSRNQLNLFD